MVGDKKLERLLGGTDRFRKNFLKIASASLLAQTMGLLSLPILTRLFSAENFGALTTFLMVHSVLLAFITGRVDWIIPNAKSNQDARSLMQIGTWLALLFIFVIGLLLTLFKSQFLLYFKFPSESILTELLFIGLIAGALQLLLHAWFVYKGDLSAIGWGKLAQASATLIVSITLGLLGFLTTGLISAYIIGFFAAAAVLICKGSDAFTNLSPKAFLVESPQKITTYTSTIIFNSALSITNVFMNMSLVFLIMIFYNNTILGWYGIVFRMATAPIGLITAGLVQSFWSDAAILVKEDPLSLRNFYYASTKRLMLVAIPLTVIFLCGPLYIPIIFGSEEWSGAGKILAAVTPYLIGTIVFSPTTHLIVYNKAHWQLACDLTTLISSCIVFAIMASRGISAEWVILSSSSIMLLGYLFRFLLHLKANTLAINLATFDKGSPL